MFSIFLPEEKVISLDSRRFPLFPVKLRSLGLGVFIEITFFSSAALPLSLTILIISLVSKGNKPLFCATVNICGTSVVTATHIKKFGFFSNSHGRKFSFLMEMYLRSCTLANV